MRCSLISSRESGFTLLEVLIALSVAAIALAAVSRLIALYVSDSAGIQERVVAHWVAENLLTEAQLDAGWPDPGIEKGDLKFMGRTWYWRRQVSETPFEAVRRAEIQVFAAADADDYITRTAGYLGEKTRW